MQYSFRNKLKKPKKKKPRNKQLQVADVNDITLIKEINYIKITFLSDCLIFKTKRGQYKQQRKWGLKM